MKHVPGLQAFESADPQQKQVLEEEDLQTHRGRSWDIGSLLPTRLSWPSGARAAKKRPPEQDVDALLDWGRASEGACSKTKSEKCSSRNDIAWSELTKRRPLNFRSLVGPVRLSCSARAARADPGGWKTSASLRHEETRLEGLRRGACQ